MEVHKQILEITLQFNADEVEMSTSHHLQTDGQTEKENRTLE
jgi:hypothetical protein